MVLLLSASAAETGSAAAVVEADMAVRTIGRGVPAARTPRVFFLRSLLLLLLLLLSLLAGQASSEQAKAAVDRLPRKAAEMGLGRMRRRADDERSRDKPSAEAVDAASSIKGEALPALITR